MNDVIGAFDIVFNFELRYAVRIQKWLDLVDEFTDAAFGEVFSI